MIEKELEIPTRDGSMNVYSASPDEVDFCPTVIFLMDAPGNDKNCTIWQCGLLPSDIMFYCPIYITGNRKIFR